MRLLCVQIRFWHVWFFKFRLAKRQTEVKSLRKLQFSYHPVVFHPQVNTQRLLGAPSCPCQAQSVPEVQSALLILSVNSKGASAPWSFFLQSLAQTRREGNEIWQKQLFTQALQCPTKLWSSTRTCTSLGKDAWSFINAPLDKQKRELTGCSTTWGFSKELWILGFIIMQALTDYEPPSHRSLWAVSGWSFLLPAKKS